MLDPFPRWLLALTAIVAIAAISVGIKDHLQQKNATSETSIFTPNDVSPKAARGHKKATSAKIRRLPTSAIEKSASATALIAGDDLTTGFVSKEFARTGANPTIVIGNDTRTVAAQAALDEAELAGDPDNRSHEELPSLALPGSSACLPLPNLTKPGDVDAPYYENWAREYCGDSALLLRP